MQPIGDPGDSLTLTRYFVVGDGNVSDISDARNEIQCLPTGTLHGTVTAGGNPAVRADVAVLGNPADGPGPRRAADATTSSPTPAPTTPATTR